MEEISLWVAQTFAFLVPLVPGSHWFKAGRGEFILGGKEEPTEEEVVIHGDG